MAPDESHSSTPATPPGGSPGALERVEDAIEEVLERAAEAAQVSAARHFGRRCATAVGWALRASGLLLLAAYFVFAILYLGTRYWLMPNIDDHRQRIEDAVSASLGIRFQLGRIETGWRGMNPHLRLADARLVDRAGNVALVLPQLEATLSWTSVPTLEPRFTELVLHAPLLEVRRLPEGKFEIAGFVLDPAAPGGKGGLADWVLAQRRISIRDLRLRYTDESRTAESNRAAEPVTLQFDNGDFEFRRGLLTHRLALHLRPPPELAGELDVRLEFRHPPLARLSDYQRWTGRAFAQTDFADVARLADLLNLPKSAFELRSGRGAVRTWLQFDEKRVARFVADFALADVDVVLDRGRAPLKLSGVQGRFEQRELDGSWMGGRELAFTHTSLVGPDGLAMPETDLRLRLAPFAGLFSGEDFGAARAALTRGEFAASRLRIDTVTRLARYAPIANALEDQLEASAVRGELFDLNAAWQQPPAGALRFDARTRFAGLAARGRDAEPLTTRNGTPRPGLPGFENLNGSLSITESGGRADVDGNDAVLEFPGVFATPRLPAGTVRASVRWSTTPHLELRFDSVAYSNPDVDLSGSAQYRSGGKGPGLLDVTAKVQRLAAPGAHLYMPLVLGSATGAWMRAAFATGEAVDGAVRLRGDLADFPFSAAPGEFQVQANVRDVNLDYVPATPSADARDAAPRWPAAANVEGVLRIDRGLLQFTGRKANVFGTQLERIDVRVPDLAAREPHLFLTMGAAGPAADLLRFVAASPVGGWLGNTLAETTASGPARTELRLDVPLRDAHATRVNGAVSLPGNDVALWPDLPTFSGAKGRVEFSESGFRLANVSAGFLGGQINVDGGSGPDGRIVLSGNGTAAAAGLKRLADIELLHRMLDRTEGTTRYAGTLTLRRGRPELRIDTDLAGWSVDLPAPLQKTSTEQWASHFEILPQPEAAAAPRTDLVRVLVGSKLVLLLERQVERGAAARVLRGSLRLGRDADADTESLPVAGMRAIVDLPRLDVDRWTPLFSGLGGARSAATAAGPSSVAGATAMPDFIAARVDELVFSGKSIANLVLGATRTTVGGENTWLGNVVSDNGTGSVTWRMPTADSPGHVSARLTRLLIADNANAQITEVLEKPPSEAPAFDVVIDSFELGERKLGRLELIARNTGSGDEAQWELQRLEIANPDGRMHATGRWYREPGATQRTMSLDLVLAFSDAGRLLARLGIPGAVRGGEGTLEGLVSWRGAPLSLDYPSLAGKLKLASTKGQFLKADAGVGRLLGVLSLQSLPRRLTLDFRDVFSEGFAFDSITATASLASGVLATTDFRMRGLNATVLIEGSSNLASETQDLHVLVLPEVNATSASLVYALLANPAIGLGTFIAQLLLRDPLSKAFSHEYDVTGSWNDPIVKRSELTPASAETNPPVRQ